jgi:hypothetical protein
MTFALHKWYLDVTADDGSAAIVYVARLSWGLLRLPYAEVLVARPGKTAPESRRRFSRRALVTLEGPTIRLAAPALRVHGAWTAATPAVEATLLDTPAGAIGWRCRQPGGEACLNLPGGEVLAGQGYVEELFLSLRPWSLPFRELRWGRFLGGGRSLVWIDWRGGLERRWVFLDGEAAPRAAVSDLAVEWDGARLELESGRELRRQALAGTVGPGLRWLLPRRLARAVEVKWVSRGRLAERGREAVAGWAIHEVVTWP